MNLSILKYQEIIKKHIESYDYHAALCVADSMPEYAVHDYRQLLEMAYAREMLEFQSVNRIEESCGVSVTPVREGDKRKYFEYALSLDLKQKRGEYADFIRAITPLIVNLYELILKKQCSIDVTAYYKGPSSTAGRRSSYSTGSTAAASMNRRMAIKKEWDSYNRMNREITQRIGY